MPKRFDYDDWLNRDNPWERDDREPVEEREYEPRERYVSPAMERAAENLRFGGVTIRDVRE